MKILAVDCSAGPASCAIFENGVVLASSFCNVKLTHSETLMPMIKNTLSSALLGIGDIDAFAVNHGPGSFTGIRIGISAIKGLALAQNKPCISVSTLHSIAELFGNFEGVVCAVMDARCSQVYNALFLVENGQVTRLCEDRAVTIDEVSNQLKTYDKNIIIAGDGANLFSSLEAESENISIAKEPLRFQNAVGTAKVAQKKLQNSETLSSDELTPLYLRLPQAERELKKKKEQER